jgi:multidrug transporter EmrE-like cation transporter
MSPYALLFAGILLNAIAQLMLKAGMQRIGHFEFVWANVVPIGMQVATNIYIFLGLMCYGISVVLWVLVLSRLEVSTAYPMVSLGYIITAVAAWAWFGEALTPMRIAGIAVIILGVFMVSRPI